MQALILAGGEGTRLRPLTTTIPKPVVPLAGQPHVTFMIEWLRRHGVDDVILACGFMADGIRAVLGDGSELGVRLRYIEEPTPLGTGGALKYAEELLDERFFMLNGDVLTDIDLSAELAQHERTGARATLALIGVEDPSAYGLVRRNADLSVKQFLEKPRAEEIDTNLINAGAYILQRELLAGLPAAGTNVSIERDVFPKLVGDGLFGYEASGYWIDIGTPQRYLQATFDILESRVQTDIGARLEASRRRLIDGSVIEGQLIPPVLAGAGCGVEAGAVVGGRTVLGRRVEIGLDVRIEDAALLDGVRVGDRSTIRGAIVGPGVVIGEDCRIEEDVVLGADVTVGSGNVVASGARIFPGEVVPEKATTA
ncbi:MAG TPA: NDP-sugar synthase [Solirubrobacteraceae bacterium]|nr:NDP-sugar synthase [Solirubrobacteraceae bacterium]